MTEAVKTFLSYLAEYFKGPLGQAEYRELFICKGDPKLNGFRDRGVFRIYGLDVYLPRFIKTLGDLRQFNIYMGVGFLTQNALEPTPDIMAYDRLAFDFDDPLSPQNAVERAREFSILVEKEFNATPLVFETGFKGAHVVIPLSTGVSWKRYQVIWHRLFKLLPAPSKHLVDFNMLQWNRVDRVPLTYNVKEEGVKYCRIIYPKPFRWESFSWRDLKLLDPSIIKHIEIQAPTVVKPVPPKVKASMGAKWVWRIVESGLPDGRKRFLFMVLIPMLSSQGDDAVLDACHKFIESSCKNFGKCDKIYDSWIMGVLRSSRERGFKGFGLKTLKEKDPELYGLVERVLHEYNPPL